MQTLKIDHKGFTLIELMMTITILAIAAAVVIPNLNSFMTNLRLNGSARTLYADLNETKILAMKTLRSHTLLIGGTSGTQQGWIVFQDTDGDGTLNGAETRIADLTLEDGITLPAGELGTLIVFDRRGLITQGSGTYTLQSAEFSKQKTLTVSMTGHMTID